MESVKEKIFFIAIDVRMCDTHDHLDAFPQTIVNNIVHRTVYAPHAVILCS